MWRLIIIIIITNKTQQTWKHSAHTFWSFILVWPHDPHGYSKQSRNWKAWKLSNKPSAAIGNLNNRTSSAVNYSRSELLQLRLRQFKIPDETFHLLKSIGILRTRGVRSGQAVRNRKHNIAISHVQRKPLTLNLA